MIQRINQRAAAFAFSNRPNYRTFAAAAAKDSAPAQQGGKISVFQIPPHEFCLQFESPRVHSFLA